MTNVAALVSLFTAAFVAATFFPAQSEALLVTLVLKSGLSVWLLVAVASVGNILGSCVNWILGRYLETFKNYRWFPLKQERLERIRAQYLKYGRWSLLLSWVPIIGDPITIAAGIMRERFGIFLLLVSIAKTGRYIALAVLTLQLVS